jgi:hypothetical protein
VQKTWTEPPEPERGVCAPAFSPSFSPENWINVARGYPRFRLTRPAAVCKANGQHCAGSSNDEVEMSRRFIKPL